MPYDAMAMAAHRRPRATAASNATSTRPSVAWARQASLQRARNIAMVLRRCDSCHLRPQTKFNWLSLAWFNSDGERLARKMRLCDDCLAENVGKYVEPIEPEERLHCP